MKEVTDQSGQSVPKLTTLTSLTENLFSRLRNLIDQSGANKHDRAIVAISACIMEGIDTGPRIIDTLEQLGFKGSHVGITLNRETGINPERSRWSRDAEGRYSLHG